MHFTTKRKSEDGRVCVSSFLKLWDELHNVQATVVGCQHNFLIKHLAPKEKSSLYNYCSSHLDVISWFLDDL
jgi:hypothetical protein